MMANGRVQKQALLPPRIPFPAVSPPPQAELGPIARPRDTQHGQGHQRTSSESVLVDEQPSWLDDLLDEPDTQARPHARPGHRRSSSDSFTLFDGANTAASAGVCDNVFDGMRGRKQVGSWGCASEFFLEPTSFGRPQGQALPWDPRQMFLQGGGMPLPVRDAMPLPVKEKNSGHHGVLHDPMIGAEAKRRRGTPKAISVRGRHQASQTAICSEVPCPEAPIYCRAREKGSSLTGIEASAEMDFLGQQNIMLDLENKSLKQRLESLSQEHVIKRVQQEMFEWEIGRLRSLFQQQQQPQHIIQQQAPAHSRSNSTDLDSQFANMSLKHNDSNSGCDAVHDLRI